MSNQNRGEEYGLQQRYFSDKIKYCFNSMYWIALIVVILTLTGLLIRAFFMFSLNVSFFIQFVALATVTVSVILLIGDLVGFVPMPITVRNGIMASFVVSVLGTSASVVTQVWAKNRENLEIRVVPLDEGKVRHLPDDTYCASAYVPRQSITYAPKPRDEFGILVAIFIRNYKLGADRDPNITGNIVLTSPGEGGVSDYQPLTPEPITSVDYWKKRNNPKCPKDFDKISNELGAKKSEIILLKYLIDINGPTFERMMAAKRAKLSVIVVDHLKETAAELNPPMDILVQ